MRKKPKQQAPEEIAPDSDEHFAYIAGYTEGGAPYGVTYEEMEAAEHADTALRTGTPPQNKRVVKGTL